MNSVGSTIKRQRLVTANTPAAIAFNREQSQ
jgi:hypothetical protein